MISEYSSTPQRENIEYDASDHPLYIKKSTLSDYSATLSAICHYHDGIEFLNSYRLQIACGLLENTNLSVTNIASNCGFNHVSYFSQLFAESFGDTPREYRKKHDRQS